MTRDEYFTHIYGQRGRTLGWLKRQGVPLTDAEILVDSAITGMFAAFDRTTNPNMNLRRGVNPWLLRYFDRGVDGYCEKCNGYFPPRVPKRGMRRRDKVCPKGHPLQFRGIKLLGGDALEAAERKRAQGGRSLPKRTSDD